MSQLASRPLQFADRLYQAGVAPWDIGEAQPIIRRLVALGAVRGDVLDPGCGTGWHAIEYARTACTVTGIDASLTAIARARRNARNAGVAADFQIGDITTALAGYEGRFDTVVDCKLLDNLPDAQTRLRYLAALHRATKPGARLYLYSFALGSVNGFHNHLVEDLDLETVLPAAGFDVTYVGPATYELALHGQYQPICPSCPSAPPGDRMTIPVAEVHAVRRQGSKQ